MKKMFLLMIILILLMLTIDSIIYKCQYNRDIEYAEKLSFNGQSIIVRHPDVFSKQEGYFKDGITVSIQFVYPLLLIVLGSYMFHKKIHSGFFKNVLARKKYNEYINIEMLKSWSAAFLIPIFIVLSFVFSCIVTNFNFDLMSWQANMFTGAIVNKTVISEILRFTQITINLFVISLVCVNVGLIFARKNKNFILSCVLGYLVIIVYQIIVAVIVGPILSNVFNNDFFANGLTLFNFWYYDSGVTFINMFIYSMILFIITTILFKIIYKDKENVIIDAEK